MEGNWEQGVQDALGLCGVLVGGSEFEDRESVERVEESDLELDRDFLFGEVLYASDGSSDDTDRLLYESTETTQQHSFECLETSQRYHPSQRTEEFADKNQGSSSSNEKVAKRKKRRDETKKRHEIRRKKRNIDSEWLGFDSDELQGVNSKRWKVPREKCAKRVSEEAVDGYEGRGKSGDGEYYGREDDEEEYEASGGDDDLDFEIEREKPAGKKRSRRTNEGFGGDNGGPGKKKSDGKGGRRGAAASDDEFGWEEQEISSSRVRTRPSTGRPRRGVVEDDMDNFVVPDTALVADKAVDSEEGGRKAKRMKLEKEESSDAESESEDELKPTLAIPKLTYDIPDYLQNYKTTPVPVVAWKTRTSEACFGNYLKYAPIGPKELQILLVKSYHKKLTYNDRERNLISELIESSEKQRAGYEDNTASNSNVATGAAEKAKAKEDDGILNALEASIGIYIGAVLNEGKEKSEAFDDLHQFIRLLINIAISDKKQPKKMARSRKIISAVADFPIAHVTVELLSFLAPFIRFREWDKEAQEGLEPQSEVKEEVEEDIEDAEDVEANVGEENEEVVVENNETKADESAETAPPKQLEQQQNTTTPIPTPTVSTHSYSAASSHNAAPHPLAIPPMQPGIPAYPQPYPTPTFPAYVPTPVSHSIPTTTPLSPMMYGQSTSSPTGLMGMQTPLPYQLGMMPGMIQGPFGAQAAAGLSPMGLMGHPIAPPLPGMMTIGPFGTHNMNMMGVNSLVMPIIASQIQTMPTQIPTQTQTQMQTQAQAQIQTTVTQTQPQMQPQQTSAQTTQPKLTLVQTKVQTQTQAQTTPTPTPTQTQTYTHTPTQQQPQTDTAKKEDLPKQTKAKKPPKMSLRGRNHPLVKAIPYFGDFLLSLSSGNVVIPSWASQVVEHLFSLLVDLTSFEPNKKVLLGLTMESVKRKRENIRKEETEMDVEPEVKREENEDDGEGSRKSKRSKKPKPFKEYSPESEDFSIAPVLLSSINFTYHSQYDTYLRPSLSSTRSSSTPWSPIVVSHALQLLINFTVDCPALVVDFLCTRSICIARLMDFILDKKFWKCRRHQEWRARETEQIRRRDITRNAEANGEHDPNKENSEVDTDESDFDTNDDGSEFLARKALSVLYNMMSFPGIVTDQLLPFMLRLIDRSLEGEPRGDGELAADRCRMCRAHKDQAISVLEVLLGL